MALKLPKNLQVVEGVQDLRRGEGIVYSLSVSNWISSTPSSATVTVIREKDESDVTSTFIPTGSASISTTTITLPEIVVPSNAQLGDYIVTVEFEAGGISPGRPWIRLVVYE